MHTCHAHPSEDSVLTRSSRIASIGRLEQLYAFCDTDCDGSISEGEFVKGYFEDRGSASLRRRGTNQTPIPGRSPQSEW